MIKAFLVLMIIDGRATAITTMPQAYPYEECRSHGRDFAAINPKKREWICIIAPDSQK